MTTPTIHVCFAAQYMRADGTPTDRTEYFSNATRAQVYAERSNANGARMRHFKMVEVVHMTDADVDAHLDAILRAAGSALKHYTLAKSKDDMRAALRAAIAKATGGA